MSEQVPVPARVMALNLMDRVDYADAFIAKNVPSHTPEEWARIIVHNASPLVREFVPGPSDPGSPSRALRLAR